MEHERQQDALRRQNETMERLRHALEEKRLVIVIGAGVTLHATSDASGAPLPRVTWTGLIRNGLDYLVQENLLEASSRRAKQAYSLLEDNTPDSSLDAASFMTRQLRQNGRFSTWLDFVFGSLDREVRHPAILEALRDLFQKGAMLLTTNYDDLLEKACQIRHIGRLDRSELLRYQRGEMEGILHIHGSYHAPSEVVLDGSGYDAITHSDEVQNILRTFLDVKTLLFVGCGSGLDDPNFGALLKWAFDRQQDIPHRHCLMVRDQDTLNHKVLVRLTYGPSYEHLAPFLNSLLQEPNHLARKSLNRDSAATRSACSPLSGEGRECLQTLYTSDYGFSKRQVPSAVPGSCQWVLHHPNFLGWQSECSRPLLWISADPGCGKSVMSGFLVDTLERLLITKNKSGIVCHFFFKQDDVRHNSASQAMCALLHQLFTADNALLIHAMPQWRAKGKTIITEFETLWQIFLTAAERSAFSTVTCVIDGLDECGGPSQHWLLDALKSSTNRTSISENKKLKFVVTGRPYRAIEQRLAGINCTRLNVEAQNKATSHDVNLLIHANMKELSAYLGLSELLRAKLTGKLLKNADRTFLWVSLVMGILRETEITTEREFEKIIGEIPCDLETTYEKILSTSTNPKEARDILKILVVAQRPFTLKELHFALAMRANIHSLEDIRSHIYFPGTGSLKAICGLFIRVIDSEVFLVHQTAKDFLLRPRSGDLSLTSFNRWKHSIAAQEAHLLLATICVKFLYIITNKDMKLASEGDSISGPAGKEPKFSQQEEVSLDSNGYQSTFFAYATQNWFHHMQIAETVAKMSLLDTVLLICEIKGWRFQVWYRIFSLDNKNRRTAPLAEGLTNIGLLAHFGLSRTMGLLLQRGALVDEMGADGCTALHRAARAGHVTTIQVLLNNRATINAKENLWGNTPLHEAAIGHQHSAALLLCRLGADLEAKNFSRETPLHVSARRGHVKVMEVLLECGASMNARNSMGATSLFLATVGGFKEAVQVLLEYGALDLMDYQRHTALSVAVSGSGERILDMLLDPNRVNKADSDEKTVLHLAAGLGSAPKVQLLLQGGARLSMRDKEGCTPLTTAVKANRSTIVPLLADKSSVNIPDNDGWTPLHWASFAGSEESVAVLLNAGAIDRKNKAGMLAIDLAEDERVRHLFI